MARRSVAHARIAIVHLNGVMRISATLVSASLVLVTCFGCAATAPTPPVPSSAQPSSASVEVEATTAEQWASVIAPLRASWTRNNIRWVASGCDAGDARDGVKDCIRLLATMQVDVKDMHTTVGSMGDPGARTGYIGTPPREVAKAYEDLDSAIRGAEQYVPFTCPGKNCLEPAYMFSLAWEMIGDGFTAWEPWL